MNEVEGQSQIDRVTEGLTVPAEVELFELDLNPIGFNQKFYFQQGDGQGHNISFGGNVYVPRPIRITGFKKSAEESPAEPTLAIGNLDKGGYSLLSTYGDLLGAKLTRLVTYAEFLDYLVDGVTVNPTADAAAVLMPEIWYLEQKSGATRIQITFRLSSVMDLRGKKIPGRDLLKKVCRRPYRVYNATTATFNYPTMVGACPYAGASSFTRNGVSTTAPYDECGKDPEGCKLRFPGATLPGWFFPGVRRINR